MWAEERKRWAECGRCGSGGRDGTEEEMEGSAR
jgi:hypothetical protein